MSITSETIKKAFAPITKAKPAEPVDVDLEKVASSFQDTIAKFTEAEDPMSKLDELEVEVDKFDSMLDQATMGEGAVATVAGSSTEFAKAFAPDAVKAPAVEAPEVEKTEAPKVEGTEKAEDEGEKTETEKAEDDLSDDIDWEADLSPATPPTTRAERMTKGERPVPARRGGRTATEKAASARDKAMARRGSGKRNLS